MIRSSPKRHIRSFTLRRLRNRDRYIYKYLIGSDHELARKLEHDKSPIFVFDEDFSKSKKREVAKEFKIDLLYQTFFKS